MKTILTGIYNAIGSLHPTVKVVLGALTAYLAFNDYMNGVWAEVFSRVDGITAASIPGADFSPLGLINYIFPIDTLLTFLVTYMALKAVVAVVRIIKSFVPTVS